MAFKTIGLISQRHSEETRQTLIHLIHYLNSENHQVVLERETAKLLKSAAVDPFKKVKRELLATKSDLVIVVGGDGSMLNAARAVVEHNKPLLGINRGALGFLADIKPNELEERLAPILAGHYQVESRCLLEVHTENQQKRFPALNEILLASADMASMIEFEIYVDHVFMCSQRSDGLIIATPTGSTAYALSAGGPILYPSLDVVVMIPMFPHSLNHRPIVLSNDKQIHIQISGEKRSNIAYVSCDSHVHIDIKPQEKIFINKKEQPLRLLHPENYNYFETLRSKLGWGREIILNN